MNIHIVRYVLALAAVIVAASFWGGEASSQVAANQAGDEAVRALQKQRLKVLQRIVHINDIMFRSGSTDISRVIRAQMTMLEARLELAADQEARVAALESTLQLAKQSHEIAKARQGRGGEIAVLEAQAMQLRIEAALLRARKSPANAAR